MSGPFPSIIPPFPGLRFLGSTQIIDLTVAVGLPATPPDAASIAALSPEAGNVRWGILGALPTGTTGTPIWGTTYPTIARSMFATIRFINMTGSTSILNIDYWG